MNMRQHKHNVANRLALNHRWAWHSAALCARSPLVAVFAAETALKRKMYLTELVEASAAEVQAARVEFVVVKKSTGEVVDTFDLEADARALIDKHRRQKKAVLELLTT